MYYGKGLKRRSGLVVTWSLGALLACAVSASADTVIAKYRLHDHPGGNQNPPPYGLRVDELGDFPTVANATGQEYLFSADTNGSQLFLDVIQTTGGGLQMHVHGTMYGGLQDRSTDPDTLDSVLRGQAEIDFWYRDHVGAGAGGVGGDQASTALYTVTDDSHSIVDPMGNTGTIVWTVGTTATTYFLQDQAGSDFSARLATNHRTPSSPDTLSFWGWVNHSTVEDATMASGTATSPDYQHFYSSDWLLTAELVAVPLPVAAWMGLSMLGGLGVVSKLRKRRQKSYENSTTQRSPI